MSYSHGQNFIIEREKSKARKCHNSCHNDNHNSCQNESCNTCHKPKPCNNQRPQYEEPKKWNALDPSQCHPFNNDATVDENMDAEVKNIQQSIESIVIKDSCDVEVTSTDTQAALNVQLALQVAIALVISISIADSSKADSITQDLNAKLKTSQINKQQVYVENSRGVKVSTTDIDIAVNVQILLQVLIALVVRLDVL